MLEHVSLHLISVSDAEVKVLSWWVKVQKSVLKFNSQIIQFHYILLILI